MSNEHLGFPFRALRQEGLDACERLARQIADRRPLEGEILAIADTMARLRVQDQQIIAALEQLRAAFFHPVTRQQRTEP